MSETTASSPATAATARPVSLITTIFILGLLTVFLFVVRHFYVPTTVAPQNAAAENLPKELQWKATMASRRATLNELRAQQAKQASSYAWVDQKAGVVQLPIERAMELTVQQYGAKK